MGSWPKRTASGRPPPRRSGALPPSPSASARSRRSVAETEARREGGRPALRRSCRDLPFGAHDLPSFSLREAKKCPNSKNGRQSFRQRFRQRRTAKPAKCPNSSGRQDGARYGSPDSRRHARAQHGKHILAWLVWYLAAHARCNLHLSFLLYQFATAMTIQRNPIMKTTRLISNWGPAILFLISVLGASGQLNISESSKAPDITRSHGTNRSIRSQVAGNGRSVAVSHDGKLLTSSNGVDWAEVRLT